MDETRLPFYAAVALAGIAFVGADAAAPLLPSWLRRLPTPILGGLAAALGLSIPHAAGWPVGVPDRGVEVDFLIGLLTTNMGLHLTPRVLRQGLPVFGLFLLGGAGLYALQLLAALPFALLFAPSHPLETAVMTGPLAYLGAPYNLNPPSQVPPVAPLLASAYPDTEATAHGMMMLGVLLGPFLATWCSHRAFARASDGEERERKPPAARERKTPSVPVIDFAVQETRVVVLVLSLVALGFGLQTILLRMWPWLAQDHVPVIVLSYLLGGATRLLFERLAGPDRFPEAALTALLLGPTMGIVLTYAIMSIPLHQIARITPGMALGGLAAIAASGALGLVLFPLFARAAGGRYYGAVVATAFVAVTTGWGPVAMSFLRRFTDERGEVEPMPAILPLNAFFLFPWMVILLTEFVFAAFG